MHPTPYFRAGVIYVEKRLILLLKTYSWNVLLDFWNGVRGITRKIAVTINHFSPFLCEIYIAIFLGSFLLFAVVLYKTNLIFFFGYILLFSLAPTFILSAWITDFFCDLQKRAAPFIFSPERIAMYRISYGNSFFSPDIPITPFGTFIQPWVQKTCDTYVLHII